MNISMKQLNKPDTYVITSSWCMCFSIDIEYPTNPLKFKDVISIINNNSTKYYDKIIYMSLSDFKCLPINTIPLIDESTFITNYVFAILNGENDYLCEFYVSKNLPIYHHANLNAMLRDFKDCNKCYVGFKLKQENNNI